MEVQPSSGPLLRRFRQYLAEDESSDRSFGVLIAAVLLAVALEPLRHGAGVRWWPLPGAGVVGFLACIRPQWLRSIKRGWLFLGFLLGSVVNPIVLTLLFYLVITPAGWLMRRSGKDPLRRHWDPRLASYWLSRGPSQSTLADPF